MKGNTDHVPAAADDIKRVEGITRVVLQVLASNRQTPSAIEALTGWSRI